MLKFYCTVEDHTHKTFWGNIVVIYLMYFILFCQRRRQEIKTKGSRVLPEIRRDQLGNRSVFFQRVDYFHCQLYNN